MEGPGDLLVEQALQFAFKATNNQAEYEAILAGLNLAHDLRARKVICKSDSQLLVDQIRGEFKVKEPLLQRYYHTVGNSIAKFDKVSNTYPDKTTNEWTPCLALHPSKSKIITVQSFKSI